MPKKTLFSVIIFVIAFTFFFSIKAGKVEAITISGNAYDDEGTIDFWGNGTTTGCDDLTTNISIFVNGAAATGSPVHCDSADGSYLLSGVTVAADDSVSVFMNATNKGVAVTLAKDGSANITLNPRKNTVWVKEELTTYITNNNLGHCDKSDAGCSNIPYTVTGNNLTVDANIKLIVESGKTFAPGGNVTTDALELSGTYLAGSSQTLTINGGGNNASCNTTAVGIMMPFCINGGTFIANTSKVNFETTGTLAAISYYDLGLGIKADDMGATFTLGGATKVNGTLTIGNSLSTDAEILNTSPYDFDVNNISISSMGTLNGASGKSIKVKGDWVRQGTFNTNTGTVEFYGNNESKIQNSNVFYNFISTAKSKQLTFFQGTKQTIQNKLTLTGGLGCAYIRLRSSSSSNRWLIEVNPTALVGIQYVDVKDSESTTFDIVAEESVDSGNNLRWSTTLPNPLLDINNVKGWAWSENIGWISMNSSNCDTNFDCLSEGPTPDCPSPDCCPPLGTPMVSYGVGIVDNEFSGYAWSDKVGWISFKPPGPYPNAASPDNTDCYPISPSLDLVTDSIVQGLARVCSGAPDPSTCGGGIGSNPDSGGWTGWICLDDLGSINGDQYGLLINKILNEFEINEFKGWAWGGGGTDMKNSVVGWISFNHRNCDIDGDGIMDKIAPVPPGICSINKWKQCMNNSECPATDTCIYGDLSAPAGCPADWLPVKKYQVYYEPVNQKPNPPVVTTSLDCCGTGTSPRIAQNSVLLMSWLYSDPEGNGQVSYEIELDDDQNFGDVNSLGKFNYQGNQICPSGKICNTFINLSYDIEGDWPPTQTCSRHSSISCSISSNCPDFAVGETCEPWLSWNNKYYYRVRVKDGLSPLGWSNWSDVTATCSSHCSMTTTQSCLQDVGCPSGEQCVFTEGCLTMPIHPAPFVDFTYCPSSPEALHDIQFCAKTEAGKCDAASCAPPAKETTCYNSSGAKIVCNNYSWVFGDDIANSILETPGLIQYSTAGDKIIYLTASDDSPNQCTVTDTIKLSLPLPNWREIPPSF